MGHRSFPEWRRRKSRKNYDRLDDTFSSFRRRPRRRLRNGGIFMSRFGDKTGSGTKMLY